MLRLVKTQDITQHEFNERIELAHYVGAPDVFDKLPPAKFLKKSTRIQIDGMIAEARQKNKDRELTDAEKNAIVDKINIEVAELCEEVREDMKIKYATGEELI